MNNIHSHAENISCLGQSPWVERSRRVANAISTVVPGHIWFVSELNFPELFEERQIFLKPCTLHTVTKPFVCKLNSMAHRVERYATILKIHFTPFGTTIRPSGAEMLDKNKRVFRQVFIPSIAEMISARATINSNPSGLVIAENTNARFADLLIRNFGFKHLEDSAVTRISNAMSMAGLDFGGSDDYNVTVATPMSDLRALLSSEA